jgi:hypothetical protein
MEILDFSPEAALAREEEWLNSNNQSIINNLSNSNNPRFALYIVRRNQRIIPQNTQRLHTNISNVKIN